MTTDLVAAIAGATERRAGPLDHVVIIGADRFVHGVHIAQGVVAEAFEQHFVAIHTQLFEVIVLVADTAAEIVHWRLHLKGEGGCIKKKSTEVHYEGI